MSITRILAPSSGANRLTRFSIEPGTILRTRPKSLGMNVMNINTAAIDDAVLALLYLTVHDHNRAWKSFDWDALSRLHERGLIADPVNKAKSVILTDEGLRQSERLFTQHFTVSDDTKANNQTNF